jgi:hypothetical protein
VNSMSSRPNPLHISGHTTRHSRTILTIHKTTCTQCIVRKQSPGATTRCRCPRRNTVPRCPQPATSTLPHHRCHARMKHFLAADKESRYRRWAMPRVGGPRPRLELRPGLSDPPQPNLHHLNSTGRRCNTKSMTRGGVYWLRRRHPIYQHARPHHPFTRHTSPLHPIHHPMSRLRGRHPVDRHHCRRKPPPHFLRMHEVTRLSGGQTCRCHGALFVPPHHCAPHLFR